MGNLLSLKIMTPERVFFNDKVEAVTVGAPDGLVTVLAGHTPMIMNVTPGMIRIKKSGGTWEESVNTEGFLLVNHEGASIFVQACEHPDEVDAHRAEEARRRAEEHMRQKQSLSEYRQSKLALARAMARLRITQTKR